MKGFESILGQDGPVRIITRLLKKGKMPHALIFTGIEGVGKCMTALALSMVANCTGPPGQRQEEANWACGGCRSCKKILSGNHPDVLVVEPEGPMIKIDQIRNLIQTLTLKPFEAKMRVVIIRSSHTMNAAAGNALLKVLEEPPNHTILILTALQTTDLLPTIISRCRQIRFNPLSQQNIQGLLEKNCRIEANQAAIIAAMSGGSYTRAEMKCRSNWIQKRKWLIHEGGFDHPEKIKKISIQVLLAYAEKLAKNKDTALESLDIIISWLRDLAVFRYQPESIVNKDMAAQIRGACDEKNSHDYFKMISAVEQAKKDIRSNLNLRLCLDMMMLKMARI